MMMHPSPPFDHFFYASRPLQVICLGRAGVDLYAREHNKTMSEVSGFEKFVGGSPANIAVALAKLGAKVGFIGCVSDDGLGDYVCDYLNSLKIDLHGMQVDSSGTRTSLAITEMRPHYPEVIIYRNNAADLALQPKQIQASYIANSAVLLVSGTALSANPSREAALLAMDYAQQKGTRVALDLDYRAYSWENLDTAMLYYRMAARMVDIIIGNREEFAVLAGGEETQAEDVTQQLLQQGTRLVIIKDGAKGCKVYTQDNTFEQGVFPVEVQKPFGAGDAFAGSLLYGLLHQYTLDEAVAMGAAAAALNVSRNSCSEAMPTLAELQQFMTNHGYPLTLKEHNNG